MRVAVTGGGGFIGSRLVRALADGGLEVRTLLGPAGSPVVAPPAGVTAYLGEIDDKDALTELVRDAAMVVHLAGPASVAASFRAAQSYARIHACGTAAVVDACRHAGVRRLVHVSSAEVYGRQQQNPVDECRSHSPRSPYAAAKIAAEAFVRAGAVASGFEAVICRPFLVYGPGMPASSLVGSLVAQVQRSNIIEVQDPRPIRDYCFVDDIVGALIASCHVVLPESVRTYNLGSGKGLSVADLSKRILKIRWGGGSVRVADVTERPREAEILELVSDSSRAARELGWRAETEIGLGLAAMLRSTEHGGG